MLIESSVVNAIKSIGIPENITIVLSDRSGVEPPAPYLLINVIDSHNVGIATRVTYHNKDEPPVETVLQVKEYNISLIFHASVKGDTHDWVNYFHTGVTSDLYEYAFHQQGLSIAHCGNIVYQSQPISGVNYKRAIIDLTLRAEVMDKYAVNPVKNIDIEGNLDDGLFVFHVYEGSNSELLRYNRKLNQLVNVHLPSALFLGVV